MKKLILILVITFLSPIYAITSINSISQFYNKLKDKELLIAYFYTENKDLKKDKNNYEKFKWDSKMFKTTDKMEKFVYFISINIDKPKLREIANMYNLDIKHTPVFVLFNNSTKVAEQYLTQGNVTVGILQEFIQLYFKTQLDKKIKEKQLEREQESALIESAYYGPFIYRHGYERYDYCQYHHGYHSYRYNCPHDYYHRPYYRRSGFHIGIGF